MHRILVPLLLALLLPVAPARAETVVTVGTTAIDRLAVDAEMAGQRTDDRWDGRPDVGSAAYALTRHEWVRQEAEPLGIAVTQQQEDAAWAREVAARQKRWTPDGVVAPLDEARTRVLLRRALLERLLFDRFYRDAPTDAAWAARFTGWQQRARAKTTCALRELGPTVCGNRPAPRDACLELGVLEACHYPASRGEPAYWGLNGDLAQALWVFNNSEATGPLAGAIAKRSRALRRRVDFDSDADFVAVYTKRRADAIAVAHIAYGLVLRKPTSPVLHPSVDG